VAPSSAHWLRSKSPRQCHQMCGSVRGGDPRHETKAAFLVATNGPHVLWRGIDLNVLDVRVLEQELRELSNQRRAESTSDVCRIADELIDTNHAAVMLAHPPSAPGIDGRVRLDESHRPVVEKSNVRLCIRGLIEGILGV